ncbi:MAG TPA: hypothetical protein VEQ66_04755 [Propionibacteriaceae bacterium]|nr:hypothetical protein [Propionibacteriaceae bacterium]
MSDTVTPVPSTGIGSWPGTDVVDALQIAFAECPELPYLPELPARGNYAGLIGRSTAFLSGLAVDLQPAGWRLTDGSGREHRLAMGTLRSDLDVVEEVAQGYAGSFKIAVAGPWTLAASMERPRGDRVLADSGARRDLGQSLIEGIGQTVAELHRRLPDLDLVVQLDEPLLPAVLAGTVATASGFSKHRSVDETEIGDLYAQLIAALASEDTAAGLVVHSCHRNVPISLLHGAGVRGLSLDLDQLTTADWDALGAAMEQGLALSAGALPTGYGLRPEQVAERVLRPVRALDLGPALSAQLVITPACGLASVDTPVAVRALRTVRQAAEIITEQLVD